MKCRFVCSKIETKVRTCTQIICVRDGGDDDEEEIKRGKEINLCSDYYLCGTNMGDYRKIQLRAYFRYWIGVCLDRCSA